MKPLLCGILIPSQQVIYLDQGIFRVCVLFQTGKHIGTITDYKAHQYETPPL